MGTRTAPFNTACGQSPSIPEGFPGPGAPNGAMIFRHNILDTNAAGRPGDEVPGAPSPRRRDQRAKNARQAPLMGILCGEPCPGLCQRGAGARSFVTRTHEGSRLSFIATNPDSPQEKPGGVRQEGSPPPPAVPGASPAVPGQGAVSKLTPEEQMALFEKHLKENDWGHQPC
jgi:hypothetical protein